jgi:hypothetical protein
MESATRQMSWVSLGDTPGPPQEESRYGKLAEVPPGMNSDSSRVALSTCGLNDKHESRKESADANRNRPGTANRPCR